MIWRSLKEIRDYNESKQCVGLLFQLKYSIVGITYCNKASPCVCVKDSLIINMWFTTHIEIDQLSNLLFGQEKSHVLLTFDIVNSSCLLMVFLVLDFHVNLVFL